RPPPARSAPAPSIRWRRWPNSARRRTCGSTWTAPTARSPLPCPRWPSAFADSLALDPHKWLSVPVECGAVLVRDAQGLRDTFSFVPSYLRTEEGKGFGGLPWFAEY